MSMNDTDNILPDPAWASETKPFAPMGTTVYPKSASDEPREAWRKYWPVDQDAMNEKMKGITYMLDRLDSNIGAQKMFDLDADWLVMFWEMLESAEKGVLSVEERLELWR